MVVSYWSPSLPRLECLPVFLISTSCALFLGKMRLLIRVPFDTQAPFLPERFFHQKFSSYNNNLLYFSSARISLLTRVISCRHHIPRSSILTGLPHLANHLANHGRDWEEKTVPPPVLKPHGAHTLQSFYSICPRHSPQDETSKKT
jgi:hypothetical protein